MNKNSLIIFCDDFRIDDNPAFFHGCKNSENITALFIFDENYQGRKIGSASKVFLHNILKNFSNLLKEKYNINLVLRKGDFITELKKIAQESDFDAIYFNQSYSQTEIKAQEQIHKIFNDKNIQSFKAKIIFDFEQIKNKSGDYFKVFTPFFKEAKQNIDLIEDIITEPEKARSKHNLPSLDLEELELLPKNEGNWHEKLAKYWKFEHDEIVKDIKSFLKNKLKNYKIDRNRTDLKATSNLSPYFRFGVISPKKVFLRAKDLPYSDHFLSEICWREFAYYVYNFNPEIDKKEIKAEYSKFAWQNNQENLTKWQKGETGFEIVDAAMKEIYSCGIMHNRTRMIVASFLIKDLLIDWRLGEEYFWDCLIDADFAVNPFSWQWVFGSGFDAAPYFRVFNPELQQEKFDPESKYRQKWLKNRKKIDKIVDHNVQRNIVLEEYKKIKG